MIHAGKIFRSRVVIRIEPADQITAMFAFFRTGLIQKDISFTAIPIQRHMKIPVTAMQRNRAAAAFESFLFTVLSKRRRIPDAAVFTGCASYREYDPGRRK